MELKRLREIANMQCSDLQKVIISSKEAQKELLEELKKEWSQYQDGRYGWALADIEIKLKERLNVV